MIEDTVIVSPKGTISLVIFFSGLSDYILKILILETVRGMQLNFFPFFLCSGSVTRPRVSYMFKRNEFAPVSIFLQIFCRPPGLRTVKKGDGFKRKPLKTSFSLYYAILRINFIPV